MRSLIRLEASCTLRSMAQEARSSSRPAPKSVLVKPTSAACNLACRYCFYRSRPSDPYRHQRTQTMSPEVLASLIAQHLRLSESAAAFGWQGGEPTLAGLDFFRQAVSFQSRYGSSGQVVSNALQTNGILLDAEWARFLRRYQFLVGVSLDGPAEVHDPWRVDLNGGPTFEQVMESLRILRRYRVATNVLAVVHHLNWQHVEQTLDFFVSQRLHYLQFVPAIDRLPDGRLTEYSLRPAEYADFLCRLFDAWYGRGQPEVSVRLFDNLVSVAAGLGNEMCEFGARCDSYYVVEFNGDVYPCDFFVTESLRLGNLRQQPLREILDSEQRQSFAAARESLPPACQACQWEGICHGGCLRYRFAAGGDLLSMSYMCQPTRTLLQHAWPRIERLAGALRPDSQPLAAAWPSRHP